MAGAAEARRETTMDDEGRIDDPAAEQDEADRRDHAFDLAEKALAAILGLAMAVAACHVVGHRIGLW
jgi:hypothetical protein